MSRAARVSGFALVLLLILMGWFTQDPARELTATTFGTIPVGFGAAFELFAGLGLPVARSYAPPNQLARGATVWWMAPAGLCDPPAGASADVAPSDASSLRQWIETGGHALVFVPLACSAVAGIAVPEIVTPDAGASAPQTDDKKAPPPVEQMLTGPIVPSARTIDTPRLKVFRGGDGWTIGARVEGQPFVLEQPIGQGRVVLIADATIFRNAWIARADNAVFAVDLVRAFGVPLFDERAHGLRAEESALLYLATSPAAWFFCGLALLGLLTVWRGHMWPARSLTEEAMGAPTLETFVSALAHLYARTGDWDRVLQRYRDFTVARLRRHFGLPPETPTAVLVERLRTTHRLASDRLGVLTDSRRATSATTLRAQARALDSLVEEAIR